MTTTPRFDRGLSPAMVKVLRHYAGEARRPWSEIRTPTILALVDRGLLLPSGEHEGPRVTAKGRIALAQIAGREVDPVDLYDAGIGPAGEQLHQWAREQANPVRHKS